MNAAPEHAMSPVEQRQQRARNWIGQTVDHIETPALVIDLDAMERNLSQMAVFAQTHHLLLRPHAKTHKSAELAKQQIALGAVGVCVQKIDEALALANGGVHNVYISNEVIAEPKLARLAEAIKTLPTRFAIAVDSTLGIDRLAAALDGADVNAASAIDVFVEIDVGHGRCGVASSESAFLLVRHIKADARLHFAGLQAYHGSAQHLRSVVERDAALTASAATVRETLERLHAAGIDVPLVTGAGTGTFVREATSGLWGELQVGSYLFMDADYAGNTADTLSPAFEHALFVKSQVMSRCVSHAVCDAGHKSHAIDSGLPQVAMPHGLQFANGGDEHGLLYAADPGALPQLGATVWLIPGHCDPTVNLHDFYIGVRGGLLNGRVERIIPIDARGALG
jgi:D-serine deaminase-like pyridoxal phosphate-dependent protein